MRLIACLGLSVLVMMGCSCNRDSTPRGDRYYFPDHHWTVFPDYRRPPDTRPPWMDPDVGPPPEAGLCGTTWSLNAATSPVVELFALPEGVLVVRRDGATLLTRGGKTRAAWTAPRPILAALVDGSTLVVADKAAVMVLDGGLAVLRQFSVTEGCSGLALFANGLLVCAATENPVHRFYTYDLSTGALLATSQPESQLDVPIRRVPGQSYLIGGVMYRHGLFEVSPAGVLAYIGKQAFSDVESLWNQAFAFDAGAIHLINTNGTKRKILGTNCSDAETSDCFAKDGALGNLVGDGAALGIDDDGAGTILELVEKKGGYELQKIDAKASLVIARQTHALPGGLGGITHLRYDPTCDRVVIAYLDTKHEVVVRLLEF